MSPIEQLQSLVKQKPYLIWYTRNYDNLSLDTIVEAVLNYGTWKDFKDAEKILGIKKLALIFKQLKSKYRSNLHYLADNYFSFYFNRYA